MALEAAANSAAETADPILVAQATGVLIAHLALSPADALEKLTAEAADLGRPVTDVAREIIQNHGLRHREQSKVPLPRTGD